MRRCRDLKCTCIPVSQRLALNLFSEKAERNNQSSTRPKHLNTRCTVCNNNLVLRATIVLIAQLLRVNADSAIFRIIPINKSIIT